MGELFRSQDMSLVQLFLQAEAAHATMSQLGELELVQFKDLNPEVSTFQRRYVNEVRRCEDLERILRYLGDEIVKTELVARAVDPVPAVSPRYQANFMDELETKIRAVEGDVRQLSRNEADLQNNYNELVELRHVLEETERILTGVDLASSLLQSPSSDFLMPSNEIELGSIVSEGGSNLGLIAGIVERPRAETLERVLWRSLRGNLYMRFAEINTADAPVAADSKDQPTLKSVFVIFTKGEQLLAKIRKVATSFGTALYPCPESSQARREMLAQVNQRITDLNSVSSRTLEHRRRIIGQLADSHASWASTVYREKVIYSTLNKFNVDVTSKCLIGEGWVCTKRIAEVRQCLSLATERTNTVIPSIVNIISTNEVPPTYFRVNKFTEAFQNLIESYGVATYKEVNPTPFAVISFPFLFAVMFGDIGHGVMMALMAGFVVWRERQLAHLATDEMFGMIYSGRYVIFMMGLFSIFTGLIYNDIFSKVIPLFSTGWTFTEEVDGNSTGSFTGLIYAFGIDYSWHGSDNLLIFLNSYKMKMAIIFGIVQMTFGIVLSAYNHVYFGRWESIWFEFIPQVIFLESIFGYLVITIFYKWCNDWSEINPPSLLNMLINMFLSPGKVPDGEVLYSGQATVQVILLAVALIAVPWMLLIKPFVLRAKHNRKVSHGASGYITTHLDSESESTHHEADPDGQGHHVAAPSSGGHGHGGHGEEFDFGEIFIHQVIHTIEFCLGAISNTASYLRLWALSLAHAQLSEVLWTMVLNSMFSLPAGMQFIGWWAGFAAWFFLTLAILVMMEGLSAFLHALRLHWVEFNNKFYGGNGYKFRPFSFNPDTDEE